MGRPTSRRQFLKSTTAAGLLALGVNGAAADASQASGERLFRAGAHVIDVSPPKLPVIVNGYTFERIVDVVHDPLHARSFVLDDGTTRVAIVVVDICVMPREQIDRAKQLAHERTGIPVERMLISATHTHSAPSVMPALGSRADAEYIEFLPGKIAEGIELAARNLTPARIGWTVIQDHEHTHSRRWIMRPDRVGTDPFGEPRDRARMCPAYQDPGAVGPAGPVDADLSLLSFQSPDGCPIALVANYSMHYFHATPVSAGYYGRFVRAITKLIGAAEGERAFVAAMSQGTSGDQMYMDYSQPKPQLDIDSYSEAVARVAFDAYQRIEYRDWVPLAMAERKLALRRRVPDEKRLAWGQELVRQMEGRRPKNRPEIFAREQIYLHQDPTAELILQALRVGDLGIAAIPCEVYGITGLKIKAESPLVPTVNFSLANGEEGYIPPPEQHQLGGYSTWEARTAGLEENAEPKIVNALLSLLEQVSGKPRRKPAETHGPYAHAVLASKPLAYWRMGEMAGPAALDASGNARHVTGYFFSRGADGAEQAPGDHLGIGGTAAAPGRLIFFNGNELDQLLEGRTELPLKTWHHVVLVRDQRKLTVYLDGNPRAEIAGEVEVPPLEGIDLVFVGGRNDRFANFAGKIGEVALYDRLLTADEVARHYADSGVATPLPTGSAAVRRSS